ncbi:GreA/GreB family elongation factor [Chloroflexota bacterium]
MSEGSITVAKAIAQYLATLSTEEKKAQQQDLNRFARWCGANRSVDKIKVTELDNYGEHVSDQNDPTEKIRPVKAFFSYAKKAKITAENMGRHISVKKTSRKRGSKKAAKQSDTIELTRHGLEDMQRELDILIAERPAIAEAIRLAAADKDFRENAPLDAAKDHQGQIEARIRELEAIVKTGVVVDRDQSDNKVRLGTAVTIFDITHDEQLCYTLVGPSEASLAKGKLSVESPIGKALVGCTRGDVVKVKAPMGTLEYKIEEIA